MLAGSRSAAAPPVRPYFTLELRVLEAPTQRGYFVPGARLVRWNTLPRHVWVPLSSIDQAMLTELSTGPPHARPTPVHVLVNGREADGPASYAALFEDYAQATSAPRESVPLELEWPEPNPWVGEGPLAYAPEGGILVREGRPPAQLPPELAAVLTRDAGKQTSARRAGVVAVVVAAALSAGAVAAWVIRRRLT
jgi:hypothetical protein